MFNKCIKRHLSFKLSQNNIIVQQFLFEFKSQLNLQY